MSRTHYSSPKENPCSSKKRKGGPFQLPSWEEGRNRASLSGAHLKRGHTCFNGFRLTWGEKEKNSSFSLLRTFLGKRGKGGLSLLSFEPGIVEKERRATFSLLVTRKEGGGARPHYRPEGNAPWRGGGPFFAQKRKSAYTPSKSVSGKKGKTNPTLPFPKVPRDRR